MYDRYTFQRVESAILHKKPLEIGYISADGRWSYRVIEPYDLFIGADGVPVIRSMDRLRGKPRSFRLDRITSTAPAKGTCQLPRPAVDDEALRARLDEARALTRIRAEIADIYLPTTTAMRWTPDCPIPTV